MNYSYILSERVSSIVKLTDKCPCLPCIYETYELPAFGFGMQGSTKREGFYVDVFGISDRL